MAIYTFCKFESCCVRGDAPIIINASTQKAAPVINVNDAPIRSHIRPAKPLASSIAIPLTRLKNP